MLKTSRDKYGLYLLFIILLLLLFSTSTSGPDYRNYHEWSNVAITSNIFDITGEVQSPMGVPLSSWPPGAGFIFAIGRLFYGTRLCPPYSDYLTGAIAIAIFWLTFSSTLGLLSKSNKSSSLVFFISLAFLATHLGYYSRAHSTESLSYACLAPLIYWVSKPRSWEIIDVLMVGATSSLLILIRLPFLIFIFVPLAVMCYSIIKEKNKSSSFYKIIRIALPISMIILSSFYALITWRWMTGSYFTSPWVFGDDSFKSFNWQAPKLWTILMHPWHGLFSYHPLYLLGFIALFIMFFQAKQTRIRLIYATLALVLFIYLYSVASYFCFWAGLGTFGSRYLGVTAIFLVPVILMRFESQKAKGRSNTVWIALSLVFAFWSYLLLVRGFSQFYTYLEMLTAQKEYALNEKITLPVLLSGISTLSLGMKLFKYSRDKTFILSGIFLFSLTLFYLTMASLNRFEKYFPFQKKSIEFVAVFIIPILIPLLVSLLFSEKFVFRLPARKVELFLISIFIFSYIVISILFFNLIVKTEKSIATKTLPTRNFKYRAAFQIDELKSCYIELLQVPGFENEKKPLGQFLKKQEEISRL